MFPPRSRNRRRHPFAGTTSGTAAAAANRQRASEEGEDHGDLRAADRDRHPDGARRIAARPGRLQAAYAAYDAGEIGKDELEPRQDEAVRDSITCAEATGAPIVSDGEQRWSSFATYPLTDTLGGTGLAENLGGDGQYFAIFADGHNRQLPRLTGGPFRYRTFAADTLRRSIGLATKPMKQAVIAPSMLSLLYPLEDEVPGYSREQFENDLCDECEKDIRQAFAAGAVRVSIDFTEGRLATRADPRNPWTGAGKLPYFSTSSSSTIA